MWPLPFALPRLSVILGCVIAALTVALYVEHTRSGAANAKLEACRTTYSVASATLDEQTRAIQKLQSEADAAAQRVRSAERKAAAIMAKGEANAASLAAANIPNDCHGALDWTATEYNRMADEWNQ
jgi:chromosome segregation ATPase